MTPPFLSSELQERHRQQAQAAMLDLQHKGQWKGSTQAHVAYQKKPLEWIVKYLEVPERTLRWSLNPGYTKHEWDGDRDPLVKAFCALADWKNCGIESATGVGKTYVAACIVFWFIACHENSLVITIAPKETQLLTQLWKEIGALWPRFRKHFPQAELLSGMIRMRPGEDAAKMSWTAMAFVCGVGADEEIAGRAKGFHREHMLFVSEETQSIHAAIMKSFDTVVPPTTTCTLASATRPTSRTRCICSASARLR